MRKNIPYEKKVEGIKAPFLARKKRNVFAVISMVGKYGWDNFDSVTVTIRCSEYRNLNRYAKTPAYVFNLHKGFLFAAKNANLAVAGFLNK